SKTPSFHTHVAVDHLASTHNCVGSLDIEARAETNLEERRYMRKLLLCLVLVFMASAWTLANADSKDKASTRTITGCLEKTSSANEFRLIGNDGSTWEVRSDTVSLSDHIGHTVSATGVVTNSTAHNMKEDTKDMAHDVGVKKNNAEHGHLKITDLQ